MTFEEKVKFLCALPQFKVIPISEVRAIAFSAKNQGDFLLGRIESAALFLDREDVGKIIREYPDLKQKLACLKKFQGCRP